MIFEFRRKSYTDIQIVGAYQNDDKKIQQFWYDKCRSQFGKGTSNYGGLTDLDRDDLFQDSFVILWEKMETSQIYVADNTVFVNTKNGRREIPDLLCYFMRIVKNKYFEMLRTGRYLIPIDVAVTSSAEDTFIDLWWADDPEIERDMIVCQCVLSLPKSCFEILTMFFYEGKTLEQILEERTENTSYNGLKTRKSKCMSNLTKRITESFTKAGLL